jgi:nitrogen regulatory protein PII
MSVASLTFMTKVEVVVSGDDVPAVTSVLETCGATGYTVLAAVAGFGHHGLHQSRLTFDDRNALRMVLSVVPDHRADALVDALRSLLSDRPGVFFVSSTQVSRPEYFT